MEDSTMKSMYELMGNLFRAISDINYYLEYIPQEYYDDIENISKEIFSFRNKCIENLNTPLIALKAYTENKCSWERAGEICDLHIFGLRDFCNKKGVDWNNLRIDEYYGLEGEEGINEIKKNWKLLDPNHDFEPIKYNGDSVYTQYPILQDKSKNELNSNELNSKYFKYKSKMLIIEYSKKFYETLESLSNNPLSESQVNTYKKDKFLLKLIDGIEAENIKNIQLLENTLDLCYELLNKSKETKNVKYLSKSLEQLKKVIVDEYYYYSVK